MPFKDISYLELWWPSCLAERNHLGNFGRGNILVKLLRGSGGDVLFRYFLSRALMAILFVGAETFRQLGGTLFEVIINLGQWCRRCRLKKKLTDKAHRIKTGHKSSLCLWPMAQVSYKSADNKNH